MYFVISGIEGSITSLNPRPENKGKTEKVLAYDIDLKLEANVGILEQLAVNEKVNYAEFFFNEKGEVRHTGIDKIVFNRDFEDQWLDIQLDVVTEQKEAFGPLKLKKFTAIPVFGHRVVLTFQAQTKPRDEELLFLNHALIKKTVLITTRPPNQLDIEDVANQESE